MELVSTLKHRGPLAAAAAHVGISAEDATPIKIGDNAIFRLRGGVVARISRPGRAATAAKEVAVARWLRQHDVPAVHPVDAIDQPVQVDDRAVTFWDELPPHKSGGLREVASALQLFHNLPPPTTFTLPALDPFAQLDDRLHLATSLTASQRAWLSARVHTLRRAYGGTVTRRDPRVVHGDAHDQNIVTTADGTVLFLDFERTAIGPVEWDLVSTAVEYRSTGWHDHSDYRAFVDAYGEDVMEWPGYELFRDIRELRMTCFVAELATDQPAAADETTFRIECLQGHHGERPWQWAPM